MGYSLLGIDFLRAVVNFITTHFSSISTYVNGDSLGSAIASSLLKLMFRISNFTGLIVIYIFFLGNKRFDHFMQNCKPIRHLVQVVVPG